MAVISLRAYNREIEGMIDNGQLDEAVAHCRQILSTFPKHIATYRLLGKAHLEQQRISDATDIFQRVLSAIPDDFIANVGMSIIREDENNLDTAIWHMELAYEAQPANLAIQDELRRLYGRRDGMQPLKPRLTRGALARMYAKGGLFDQAIAELRAAILEDPNRQDLQLLMAQMYFQMSMRVEAVEACMTILKKLPLCLEANRILAVSLPESEGSNTVQNARQTVISMDPYFAFAEAEAISSDQVPDSAVNLEMLDWKSGIPAGEAPEQPAWAASLGIAIEKPADENLPDWLKSSEAPSPAVDEKAKPSISPFIWDTQEVEKIITDTSKTEPEVPDWMKDAGWKTSNVEATQPAAETSLPGQPAGEPVEAEDLEKADIPEWLKGIAPLDITTPQTPESTPAERELSTPWLEPHQPGPTDSIIQWLDEKKPAGAGSLPAKEETPVISPDEEIPEWLKDLDLPQPAPVEAEAPPETTAPTPSVPSAFIAEPEAGEGEGVKAEALPAAFLPVAEEDEEMPEWLRGMATGSEAEAAEAVIEQAPEQVIPASELETAPEASEATPSVAEEENPVVAEQAPTSGPIEAPAIAAIPEEPVETEELPVTKPLAAPGAFLEAEKPAAAEGVPAEEEPAVQGEIAPEAQIETAGQPVTPGVTPTEEQPQAAGEKLASHLPEIGGMILAGEMLIEHKEAPQPEEMAEFEEITPAEAAAISQAAASTFVPAQEGGLPTAEIPLVPAELAATEQPAAPEGELPPAEAGTLTDAEAFAWLESLAAEQEAKAEEQAPPPNAEEIAPPEWVKLEEELTTEESIKAPAPPIEPIAAAPAEEELDWIKGLGEEPEAQPIEQEAAVPSGEEETTVEEELPAWLAEMEAPEAAKEPLAQPEEEEWKAEEIPAWLKEITESEEVEGEKPAAVPAPAEAVAAAPVTEAPATEEVVVAPVESAEVAIEAAQPAVEAAILPEAEIAQPTETPPAELVEPEAQPGVVTEVPMPQEAEATPAEATPAEAIPTEAILPEAAPTEAAPAEITPAEEAPAEVLTTEAAVLLSSEGQAEGAAQTALAEARNAVSQGQADQAIQTYSSLIQQNYRLEEIVKDLQEALYRFPVNVEMWVTLGDAHAQTNNLQQALDAYTKAEELVR